VNSLARHTEGIKVGRGRENSDPARKERVGTEGRGTEGGREGVRERLTREEGSLKKGREGESGVKEQTLHVAVEGVIPLWRGTNSQVRQTL